MTSSLGNFAKDYHLFHFKITCFALSLLYFDFRFEVANTRKLIHTFSPIYSNVMFYSQQNLTSCKRGVVRERGEVVKRGCGFYPLVGVILATSLKADQFCFYSTFKQFEKMTQQACKIFLL